MMEFETEGKRIKQFSELLDSIIPEIYYDTTEAKKKWDSLAKPLGSLGVLEDQISKIAALRVDTEFELSKASLFVIIADNGVVSQGVSQSDSSVTLAVAKALGLKKSTINHLAGNDCEVIPVNVGMEADTPPGVRDEVISRSTGDITERSAMTHSECIRAILLGEKLTKEEADKGCDLILLGEMGIGNTTTSAAVTCALLGADPNVIVGRGAGLSDEGLKRKIHAVEKALALHGGAADGDPIDTLCYLGGLDLAVLCGICLGAARYHVPVLLDGVITCAAALVAARLCPGVKSALLASHVSREPAAAMILKELGLAAPIRADLHLGEGSGAVLALSLLRQTLRVYNSAHTFEHLGIDAYTPQ